MADASPNMDEIRKRMELSKENCIFCKIASKKMEGKIVFEDNLCIAIMDIAPASVGHLLLMPKEHYMMMPLVPDEVLGHLSVISKYLGDLIMQTLTPKDITMYTANGYAAGQNSQHFMMHIIPRYEDDGLTFDIGKAQHNPDEMVALAAKIKESLTKFNSKVQ